MKTELIPYICLLRGINVGGNSIISMKQLKASFENAGFKDVVTYINSGNIIFKTKKQDPRILENKIERILDKEYAFNNKVVVKNFDEIQKIIKNIPKTWKVGDISKKYNVIFLRHTIDAQEHFKELKPKPDIEEVIYKPGVLFWSALTSDLTHTTMIKLSSSKIYKEVTVRNLNTTKKIYELMKSAD
jgi:uncharacterized protein (DUF1697 family)